MKGKTFKNGDEVGDWLNIFFSSVQKNVADIKNLPGCGGVAQSEGDYFII